MKKKGLVLFIYIILIFILLTILNFLMPNILEYLRNKDRAPESPKISVTPRLVEGSDNIYAVDINFKTQTDEGEINEISAVSFSLSYPADNTNQVEVVNLDGEPVEQIDLGSLIKEDSNWRIPFNNVIRNQDGVIIEFAAVNLNPDGFSSANGTALAVVYFKSDQPLQNDAFILNFDADNTVILTKSTPTKNIRGDESKLYYAVEE